ncbi:hypothetical protein [Succinivibrio sp.]|uniref:hypothetical protein n=1 Tax=Succinivibrio sp. TaxID=2053619 RepID=UPI0025DCF0B4|nr:hypothetical protein [Succinivibrio sp.]MBQ9221695.1 hypothetical protein [Succinivibrio sp.]
MNEEEETKTESLLSAKRMFRKSIKVKGIKDWLIPRMTACVILGVSDNKFHRVYKKRKAFPKAYLIKGRTYYSMKEISQFADAIEELKKIKKEP